VPSERCSTEEHLIEYCGWCVVSSDMVHAHHILDTTHSIDGVLWEVRNALLVFPLFVMGKIVLTYDHLELRPALVNELSSLVKGQLY
jgi:hypothetical protein